MVMVKWESTWTLQHLLSLFTLLSVYSELDLDSLSTLDTFTINPRFRTSSSFTLNNKSDCERRPKLETFPIDICFSLAWPGRALRVDYTLATPPPAKGVEKGENVSFINFSLLSIIVLQNWNLCVNIELIMKSPSLFLFCKHLLIEISSVATLFYHFILLLDCNITRGHREDMDFSCRHVR